MCLGNDREQTYVAYLFSDVARPSLVAELPVKTQLGERVTESNRAMLTETTQDF
jgi:hypothetical protein